MEERKINKGNIHRRSFPRGKRKRPFSPITGRDVQQGDFPFVGIELKEKGKIIADHSERVKIGSEKPQKRKKIKK